MLLSRSANSEHGPSSAKRRRETPSNRRPLSNHAAAAPGVAGGSLAHVGDNRRVSAPHGVERADGARHGVRRQYLVHRESSRQDRHDQPLDARHQRIRVAVQRQRAVGHHRGAGRQYLVRRSGNQQNRHDQPDHACHHRIRHSHREQPAFRNHHRPRRQSLVHRNRGESNRHDQSVHAHHHRIHHAIR